MGSLKKKMMEYENVLNGSESLPPINGAYLYVYKGDKLLGIVSIPSPNLMAENYRDSVVTNYEELVDEEGNEYEVEVISSNAGIDWEFVKYPDDENILKQLKVEVKYNEF
jgi:hypothetical protein